jgi:hypothetical protein
MVQNDPELRELLLNLERRWEQLARIYEFAEHIDHFRKSPRGVRK